MSHDDDYEGRRNQDAQYRQSEMRLQRSDERTKEVTRDELSRLLGFDVRQEDRMEEFREAMRATRARQKFWDAMRDKSLGAVIAVLATAVTTYVITKFSGGSK